MKTKTTDKTEENIIFAQNRKSRLLAIPFFVVMFAMTIAAFIIPLRPQTSERERRKLREFPNFSIESVLNGVYFSDISLWFSDTFPGREEMLEVASKLDRLHGFSQNEVSTNTNNTRHDEADLDTLLGQLENTKKPDETASFPEERTEEQHNVIQEAELGQEEISPSEEELESWGGIEGNGEEELFDSLVLIDGTVMARLGFNQPAVDQYARFVNQAGDALSEKGIRFFHIPVPTGSGVLLSSETQEALGCADQGKTIRYLFALENDSVTKVNIINSLLFHNSEYLYYHSDYHWTALGAYYAYEVFCREAGYSPIMLEDYEEISMGEFIGNYYYSVNYSKITNDEVVAFIPPGAVRMDLAGYPELTSVIVDKREDSPKMKYYCFINGDNPITVITNDDLPEAPNCLLIKDSYGNPFSVYLSQHYHKVYVIDFRKVQKLASQLAEDYDVQDVILIQSMGTIQSLSMQIHLKALMG